MYYVNNKTEMKAFEQTAVTVFISGYACVFYGLIIL